MRNKRFFLILFSTLIMLVSFIAFVYAQDTSNMSNEEIIMAMMSMIRQMQQTDAEPADDPALLLIPAVTETPQGETLSNDEILLQMYLMLQQMQQGNTVSAPEPTATPLPTSTPRLEASFSNDELLLQMYLMLQQLQQGNTVGTSGAATSEISAATGTFMTAGADTETGQFSVWKNKKLIIETLPSYLFIQPTKEPKPEPEKKSEPTFSPRDDYMDDSWIVEEYYEEDDTIWEPVEIPDCKPGCTYDEAWDACVCG